MIFIYIYIIIFIIIMSFDCAILLLQHRKTAQTRRYILYFAFAKWCTRKSVFTDIFQIFGKKLVTRIEIEY